MFSKNLEVTYDIQHKNTAQREAGHRGEGQKRGQVMGRVTERSVKESGGPQREVSHRER